MLRANWPIRHDGVTYDTGADVAHLPAAVLESLAQSGTVTRAAPAAPAPDVAPAATETPSPSAPPKPAKKGASHA